MYLATDMPVLGELNKIEIRKEELQKAVNDIKS